MALSTNLQKRLFSAVTDQTLARELIDAINGGVAGAAQDLFCCPLAIVATSTSTTTNFATLAVGDLVAVIPAVAGNSHFVTVATAGTLPEAAVVGSLYIALRAFVPSAASTVVL